MKTKMVKFPCYLNDTTKSDANDESVARVLMLNEEKKNKAGKRKRSRPPIANDIFDHQSDYPPLQMSL